MKSVVASVFALNVVGSVKITQEPVTCFRTEAPTVEDTTFAKVTVEADAHSILPDGSGLALTTLQNLTDNDAQAHLRESLRERIKKQAQTYEPTVYFYGDSTVRNQWMAYCSLLRSDGALPEPMLFDFGRVKERLYKENTCTSDEGLGQAAFFYTWGTWEGSFPDWARQRHFQDGTLLVAGVGHQLLQQVGRPWNAGNARRFVNYENDYNAFVDRTTEMMSIPQRVIQTHSSLCEDHFHGDWVVEERKTSSMACVRNMTADGIDDEHATRVCEDSLFTRDAVLSLNDRLRKAHQSKGCNVYLADIFKVTDGKCDKTNDGVHFNLIALEQLEEIFRAAAW